MVRTITASPQSDYRFDATSAPDYTMDQTDLFYFAGPPLPTTIPVATLTVTGTP